MAITSSSQVLQVSKVNLSTGILDDAISSLNNAKSILNNAKRYCSYEVFNTNEGNTLPSQIDSLIAYINEQIVEIRNLKNNVNSTAEQIYRNEKAEYDQYLKEQEEKESSSNE